MRTYTSRPVVYWRVRWPVFVGIALVLGGAAIIPLMLRSANISSTRPARPNVLLITIDTLRWDRVGAYGAAHNPTPVLDRLASRGTRFETAIAHAPLTAPSHASILTGLTPVRHGVRDNGAFVLAEQITLASTLGAAGYSTAAFVSGFPLDRRFGFAAGFQTYDDRLPATEGAGRAAYTERRADETTARALAWLGAAASTPSTSRGSQPWFLWIHYFDPHASYDPPEPWKSKMPSPYDGEVAFVDDQIGRVLGRLSEIGATSQTIVAVTADHGESLGEHGEETHGVFIYDATLRVPLIMAGPGISTGTVATVVGRGVDVMPTLLDLAGLQVPERLDGRTLRTALEGRLMDDEGAYIESLLAERQFGWAPLRGFREARWKYIDSPEPELYDLLHDAAELKNRATEAPRRTEALATNLADKLKTIATPDRRRPQVAMDREAAEQLRALGYVSGGAPPPTSGNFRNPKGGIQLINRLERGIAKVRVDPRRAVEELRAVLVEDPGIAVARSQLAVALSYTGDRNGAIEQLRILTADRTASAEDLVLLSELHRAAGNSAKAAETLQHAAALDPQSPEVAVAEGRSLMIAQDLEKASAAFDRALKLWPDHSEALVGLGEIAMAKGDLNGASATFERVLSRDPANPGALAAMAAALAKTGRPQEAVPYFERAVAAGQRSPAVLNGLGFAKLESGDPSGALTVLRRSLTIEPNQPQVQQAVRDLTERSRNRSNK